MANLETWLAEENSIIQKPDNEKQVYLYEWLERLVDHLISRNATNAEVKKIQPKIVSTLHKLLDINCSPATRRQLGKCFATIYNTGTTMGLFDSVNKCIDIIKSRDDSVNGMSIKLSAICCLGGMYEILGRMVATLFDAALQNLTKILYKAESQAKCEILLCLQQMLYGLGNSASTGYKDIYKACKACLVDKWMPVRWAAAKCALELSKNATFLCTTDLETMVSVCLKALEGSNYDVRIQVAQLLGSLMAGSQKPSQYSNNKSVKKISPEDMFGLMAAGFLKGGIGFLKSGGIIESGLNNEIRVGVTQAYVVFFHEMGTKWVSKYIAGIIIHILELAASQKATATHIDAVYSRKCVSFILHSVFHEMLPEGTQVQAVKELCKIITKQMNRIHDTVTSENEDSPPNLDVISTQHVLVCALAELSSLVLELTSSIKPIMNSIIVEAVFSTLIHPVPAVWLSAAWCIRCCTIALPSNMANLIDVCTNKMNSLRASANAVTGYGYTLAAIIGGLYKCPLGIPYSKAKALFTITMELLQNTGKNAKFSIAKVQTGWILLGALCTLGSSFVKNCLPDMLQIWSSVFPADAKAADSEKHHGNLKTWQLTLENRAGALCSICSFIAHCKNSLTKDVLKKLMVPVQAALALLPTFNGLLKVHGAQLQASIAMFKARLYQLLFKLQPKLFEASFTPLLRDLVAVFTLSDRKGSTTTSLLQSLCHEDDSVLLGSWLQETDHKDVEEQLQLNSASGSGALEHDPAFIYASPKDMKVPGPLPLGVAVIDSAIALFGHIFPYVTNKHRGQLMTHFQECILKNKGGRQQAIQTNIFTAFLAALKNLAENKSLFGEESVRRHANSLVQDALANTDNILRCAAGEALGRMAQVINDTEFVAKMVQESFEKCQKTPDAVIRTGHALALGCLHRYVGGMGSGHHLVNSVSILIALAKDSSSTLVQIWSLHALTLIVDSGGPMFRTFVDQSFYTVINLMLRTPSSMTAVHQCLGKCVGALTTAIGPELQDTSKAMERSRMFCMVACSIMQNHPDSLVQSEAIRCMQQLHLFAPNVVNLNTLVPHLCKNLLSPHLLLRRASVDCLRQLSHREARDVCGLGKSIVEKNEEVAKKMYIGNKGLEGLLFSLLDAEIEGQLLKHIRETIASMLQELASNELKHWLGLCKQVLLASNASDEQEKPAGEEDDGEEEGTIVVSTKEEYKPVISPKWSTRVFAMECTRMILEVCRSHQKHRDLAHARVLKEKNPSEEFLVTQLSELVRMAFIAGTSTNNLLKLEGMKTLQDVVLLFGDVPDPDIAGHLILEQFQAQVGTALRPAFADNIPPDVTAMACEVCSSWIGCGISRDINDVRRIQQLLVHSLEKIESSAQMKKLVYSESAYTLETLAVLKAWAQIYIMAIKHDDKESKPSEEEYQAARILDLVEKDLKVLVKHWIGALRDYVLLTLPSQYASQLPPEGGVFYSGETVEEVRPHYKQSWPPMVHAVTRWLTSVAFDNPENTVIGAGDEVPPRVTMDSLDKSPEDINKDRFYLTLGICMEALCSPMSNYPTGTLETCVNAIHALLNSKFGRQCLLLDKQVCIELLTVLHRLLLSCDESRTQQLILEIIHKCALAFHEKIEENTEMCGGETEETLKEIRENELVSKKSIVFCMLEISTYIVTKYANEIMPSDYRQTTSATLRKQDFSVSSMKLLASTSSILSSAPSLCTPSASVIALPTILFLNVGILNYITMNISETFDKIDDLKATLGIILKSFKNIITCSCARDECCSELWQNLLQSAFSSLLQIPVTCCSYDDISNSSSPVFVVWENLLLLFSLFILHSPSKTIAGCQLLKDCIDVFARVIQSAHPKLRLPCVKIVESLVKCSDEEISVPFIHHCVPYVVGILEESQTRNPTSDAELSVCKESIATLELLLNMVHEDNRMHLMSLYLPALIHLLHDSHSLVKANSFSRSLHEYCIQRLTAIGPVYPLQFKSCMGSSPKLKEKLTAGIKANQSIKSARSSSVGKSEPTQPQIKLKMDFSNFK